MKKYLIFLTPILAVTVIACCISFSAGFRLGKLIALPTPVVDLRTIGSACTMKKDAKLNWDWWKDEDGNVCGYLNEDSIMLTAYARQTDSLAMFSSKADAVQWVESRPYRQGGAK